MSIIGLANNNVASVKAYNLQNANDELLGMIIAKTNAFQINTETKILVFGCIDQRKAADKFRWKRFRSPFFDVHSDIWGHSINEIGFPMSCQFSRLNSATRLRYPGSNIKWIKVRRSGDTYLAQKNFKLDGNMIRLLESASKRSNSSLHKVDESTFLFVFSQKHLSKN